MKKLFGILLSLSLICAMGTSLVGCKTEDKKA